MKKKMFLFVGVFILNIIMMLFWFLLCYLFMNYLKPEGVLTKMINIKIIYFLFFIIINLTIYIVFYKCICRIMNLILILLAIDVFLVIYLLVSIL